MTEIMQAKAAAVVYLQGLEKRAMSVHDLLRDVGDAESEEHGHLSTAANAMDSEVLKTKSAIEEVRKILITLI